MAPLPTLKGAVLRIMALGASITWGTQSTDGNGYRGDLYTSLTQLGAQVTMTGNQAHGSMVQSLNEGWPGYIISQIDDKAKASVPKWKPNVVLVNAGTNDCVQNVDIPNAGARMQGMLQDVWSLSPNSTIVLSSLLVNAAAGTEKNVELVNPQYASLAKQLQAQGKKLVYVDMHASNGPQLSDLVDGTHPDDAGYAKMAAIWLTGLQEASSKGWLSPPT
jgi:lysophospholipase L1-like esterase